jgi:flagellar protein FlbD
MSEQRFGEDSRMIEVTQLSGVVYYVNPHQIETMGSSPDTVITMLSGKRIIVKESIEEIIDRIVAYRRRIGIFKNEE